MDLSIIIPTYNRADLIEYTLRSLDKRLHPGINFEIIVVDDGSTDNTADIINTKYPLVRVIKNEGKGAAAARNTGLAVAAGKYISYLDSDDLIGEGFFRGKIKYLEEYEKADTCYGEYEYFESNEEFVNENVIFKYKYPVINSADGNRIHLINFLSGNFIPPLAILWRKSFLDKIGGHDPSLRINQDVELVIRALLQNMNMRGIADGTYVYIRHHALDSRVGDAANSEDKFRQILQLRERVVAEMRSKNFNDKAYYKATSTYLFNYWRSIRRSNKILAEEFLQAAKNIFWPIPLKGSFLIRTLARILGPVGVVKIKYFLLKRD